MIERFNFYDLYGYLIPGAVWLGLLMLPFALAGAVGMPGAAELTLIGLVGGYVAGHFLGGFARRAFPSRKYADREGRELQLSDVLLIKEYAGANALSPGVWELLRERVQERFDLDIANAEERRGVFFLCRTALAQGKVGSYVEQYQGMLSLTRSLATACLFSIAFYFGSLAAFCLQSVRLSLDRIFTGHWPLLTALGPVLLLLLFDKRARELLNVWDVKETPLERSGTRSKPKPNRPAWKGYLEGNMGGLVLAVLLLAAGFIAEGWFPLTETRAYQLAAISSVLLIAVPRFHAAANAFDESLATSVFRDFIVLSTGKKATDDSSGL